MLTPWMKTAPPLIKREESADLETIFKITKYFFKFEVNGGK